MDSLMEAHLEPLTRATRDVRSSAALMGREEARYLVDLYYTVQDYRTQAANQERSSGREEPTEMVAWTFNAFETVEKSIKSALDSYSSSHEAGVWAKSMYGIGPVIASGLLAHIDIDRAPTAGNVWAFAGLDPSKVWGKGQKRPWNAKLKVLCWKIGDSFVKFSGRDECFYGHYYRERKAIEVARNEAGEYAEIARQTLEARRFKASDTKKAYEAGRLPDGRIDLRARRWAVKLFLAHYHHVLHVVEKGEPPPRPYVLAHGGHAHYIAPPGFDR